MSRKALDAIINAARHVAVSKLKEAAQGSLPKLPVFCATMALEAAHAYLSLYPDMYETEAAPPLEINGDAGRSEADGAGGEVVEMINASESHYAACRWGPN